MKMKKDARIAGMICKFTYMASNYFKIDRGTKVPEYGLK
jgi:hypothetical protein